MIYSQTIVATKSALPVIPPRIESALFRVQTKGICKSPLPDFFKRRALAFAEQNMPFPLCRVVHVALFRRNIEVAAEQHTLALVIMLIEETAQPLHPFQLETIFIRTNKLPVRDIHVDDAHAFDCRRDQTRLRSLLIIMQASLNIRARTTREN